MASSKRNERSAIANLRRAREEIFAASNKLRSDSTATILSGQLVAARLILDDASDTIDNRTSDPAPRGASTLFPGAATT